MSKRRYLCNLCSCFDQDGGREDGAQVEQVVSALNKAWRQVKQSLRQHEDEAEKTSLHDEEYTSLLEAARASIYDIGQLVEEINQPINQDTAQDVHKCCQVPKNS